MSFLCLSNVKQRPRAYVVLVRQPLADGLIDIFPRNPSPNPPLQCQHKCTLRGPIYRSGRVLPEREVGHDRGASRHNALPCLYATNVQGMSHQSDLGSLERYASTNASTQPEHLPDSWHWNTQSHQAAL